MFIDYQNVYRDANRAFGGGLYSSDGQIDPIRYAQHLAGLRPQGSRRERRALEAIRIYRGRPHSEKQAKTAAAHMRQVATWEKEGEAWKPGGLTVVTRDLRYPRDYPRGGGRPEEKGIDVALAIDAVTMAINRELDVAMLASTDTDQRPVLEAFAALPIDPAPTLETVAWMSRTFSKKLQAPDVETFVHRLSKTAYEKVHDDRDYNVPG
ncbi:MAG: NYN domain-containing protein [Thermomicrobiales bacterium]|nr:NYN domain-containing protein [Thermomicrobiales bacterium]